MRSPLYRLDSESVPLLNADPSAGVVGVDPISLKFAQLFFHSDGTERVTHSIARSMSSATSLDSVEHLSRLPSRGAPMPSSRPSTSSSVSTSLASIPPARPRHSFDLASAGLFAAGGPQPLYNPLDETYATPASGLRRLASSHSKISSSLSFPSVDSSLSGLDFGQQSLSSRDSGTAGAGPLFTMVRQPHRPPETVALPSIHRASLAMLSTKTMTTSPPRSHRSREGAATSRTYDIVNSARSAQSLFSPLPDQLPPSPCGAFEHAAVPHSTDDEEDMAELSAYE
jgi:hypothetical protein